MIIQNVISGTTVCYGDLAAALTNLRKPRSRSSETKHEKRNTVQPTVKLSTFYRNTEERKL